MSNNYYKICVQNKWGFEDENNAIVIEPRYDSVRDFSEDRAAVCINNKWGFINDEGKMIISPKYSEVRNFNNGFALVTLFDEFSWAKCTSPFEEYIYYINRRGVKLKTSIDFNIGTDFNNDIAIVGILDFITTYNPSYYRTHYYQKNSIEIRSSKAIRKPCDNNQEYVEERKYLYGVINKSGESIIDCIYDDIQILSRDYLIVKLNSKWGVINLNNESVIEIKYELLNKGINNALIFTESGKKGVVDMNGNVLIPAIYDSLSKGIYKNRYRATLSDEEFFIDEFGEKTF